MSWYKIAQDQGRNLIQQGLGTATNPAGIKVSFQDYQSLKNFGPNSGPVTVVDKDTNSNVTVVHGSQTPDGKFALSLGANNFVIPSEDPNWAQKLGINPSNYIVACYQGSADVSGMRNATNYRGILQLETPQNVNDPSQDVRINVSGA